MDGDQVKAAADEDKPKQAEFRQANPGDNPVGEDGKTERQREVEHSQEQARRQQQADQRNEADDERRQRAVDEFRRDPSAQHGDLHGGDPVGSAPADRDFSASDVGDPRRDPQANFSGAAATLDPRGFPLRPGERETMLDGKTDEQRAAEAKKIEAEAGHGGVAGKPDDGSQQGDGANQGGAEGKGGDV